MCTHTYIYKQALNSILSPRIEREKQQQAMLQMENDFIQQKLGYLAQLSESRNGNYHFIRVILNFII